MLVEAADLRVHRRAPSSFSSSRLSLSSLMADAAPPLLLAKDAVADACADVTRELAAVDVRLRRLRQQRTSTSSVAAFAGTTSDTHSLSLQQQQQAGQVADEVESALSTCERLLQRAKAAATAGDV